MNINVNNKKLFFALNIFLFFFLLFLFFNHRPILDTDEFINIARNYNPKSIMDYSLRPFYRIINIFWLKVLGKGLDTLLIGSAIFFTFMSLLISIFTWHISKKILLVFFSSILLFISPEMVKTSFGALPHVYSGFFLLLYGTCSYLKIQSINENNIKFFAYFLISYLCCYIALMIHPTIAFIIIAAPLIDLILISIIKNFSKEYNKFVKKYILTFVISFFVFWFLIFVTEFIYILYKDQGVVSYFSRWYNLFFSPKPTTFTNYYKPYAYYYSYLLKDFTIFFVFWLVSILFMIFTIFKNKIFFDIKKTSIFIPAFLSILHISAISFQSFKVPDALASFAPIATLSIIFFANQIFTKNYFINFNIFIILVLNVVLIYKSIDKEHSMHKPWEYLKLKNDIQLNVISLDYSNYPKFKRGWNDVRNCYRIAKAANISYRNISLNIFKNTKYEDDIIFCMGANEVKTTNFLEFAKNNNYCNFPNFKVNHMFLFKNCDNLE